MFGRIVAAIALAIPLLGAQDAPERRGISLATHPVHPWVQACEDWDEWDKPGPAFKVYGNTYYVGTCGIASILITSDEGHTLIDTGTEDGAEIVLNNIRSLGFDPADIKLLLNSHEHFDHVGGMARIQELTGAQVVSSMIGAQVLASGQAHESDPQFGMYEPMRPVRQPLAHWDGAAQILLHQFGIWAIPTPGHTPGAMSWKWRSCEEADCRVIVYADSLSAVSRDGYRFVDNEEYLGEFLGSLQRVADANCQILLSPHPSASWMRGNLLGGDLAAPYGTPCDDYMRSQRARLLFRIVKEDPEIAKQYWPTWVEE